MSRRRKSTIPLVHRLPNRPPLFIDRVEAQERLATLLRRAPLGLVSGEEGVGKTSLVSATFERLFPERLDRTVYLRFASEGVPIVRRLLGVLAPEAQPTAVHEEPGDRIALMERLIDVVAELECWVVLDDVGEADVPELRPIVRLWARYSRRARLVLVGRELTGLEAFREQHLVLPPLELADIVSIAVELGMAAGHATEIAAAAGGNPGRLRQIAAGNDAPLVADDAACVALLAAARYPLPASVLEAGATQECLARLSSAGLVRIEARGVELSSWARSSVARKAARPAAPSAAHIARHLQARPEPELRLESVRFWLLAARPDEADRALSAAWSAIEGAGLLDELNVCLCDVPSPSLDRWKLRISLELGGEALITARRPMDATLADSLRWAQVLFLRADLSAAHDEARRVERWATQEGDDHTAFEVGILLGRIMLNAGQTEEAARELRSLIPRGAEERAERDALLANVWVLLGKGDEGLKLSESVREQVPHLRPESAARCLRRIARMWFDLGRPREALELSESTLLMLGDDARRSFSSRHAMMLEAQLLLTCGRLEELSALLDRITLGSDESTFLSLIVRGMGLSLRLFRGTISGLTHDALALYREAAARGVPNLAGTALELAYVAATLEGHRIEPPELDRDRLDPQYRMRLDAQAARYHCRVHRSRAGALRAWGSDTEGQIQVSLIEAELLVLSGEPEDALRKLDAASSWDRTGYRLCAIEAQLLRCEAFTASSRLDDAVSAARQLLSMATEAGSSRLAVEAQWFIRCGTHDSDLPESLEALCAGGGSAPVAARRARALLGSVADLDALDEQVLVGLAKAGVPRARVVLPSDGEDPDWGIDQTRRAVWFGNGRVERLERHPLLWQLLWALSVHGGSLSKERLIETVWHERRYIPRLHDNKLRLAVAKLRRLIEREDARARIVTVDGGYGLRGPLRVWPA